jgi:hypothetical protein
MPGRALKLVDFRRQDKVAFGEAVDLVGPRGYFGLAPGEKDIRVMSFTLRDRAHLVHKLQGLRKIGKCERARDVMCVHYFPLRHLPRQVLQLLARQGWHSPPARLAFPARQIAHALLPDKRIISSRTKLYRNPLPERQLQAPPHLRRSKDLLLLSSTHEMNSERSQHA